MFILAGLPDEFWVLTSVGRGDRSSPHEGGNAEVDPEVPTVLSASSDGGTRLQDTRDDDGKFLLHAVRCILNCAKVWQRIMPCTVIFCDAT